MAFSYNKKNLANTTITGAITASDTTITVNDGTVFNTSNFYATLMPSSEMSTIDNSEIVFVSAINGNTLTVTRAQRGTTARTFSAGAIITNGIYTEDLDRAQAVGEKIFSMHWDSEDNCYRITDDMLKIVPDNGTTIRVVTGNDSPDSDYTLSVNADLSGISTQYGRDIIIANASNSAPKSLQLYGDTYQPTYTGKNYLNLGLGMTVGTPISDGGVTAVLDEDGYITINGTATGVISLAFVPGNAGMSIYGADKKLVVEWASGTVENGAVRIQMYNADFSGAAQVNLTTQETQTSTFNPTTSNYVLLRLRVPTEWVGMKFNDVKIRVMVAATSADNTYEPYTGRAPAPSPDYPQPIKVVTGEQMYTIYNGSDQTKYRSINLGKNLFDVDNPVIEALIPTTQNTFVHNTDANSVIVQVQPNTTYTVSRGTHDNADMRVAVSQEYPSTSVSATSVKTTESGDELTITTGPKDFYLLAYVYYGSNYTTLDNILATVQVEKGSTSTAYAAYFAPVELRKMQVGNTTYQDYIYKSTADNKWYLHRAVGREIYKGEDGENWISMPYGTNSYITPLSTAIMGGDDGEVSILSDQFTAVSFTNRTLQQNNIIYRGYTDATPAVPGVFIRNTSFASVADLKAWLSSHPLTVYYVYAPASDIEITNPAVITDLENAANTELYEGYNEVSMSNDYMAAYMNLTYYNYSSGEYKAPIVTGAHIQGNSMSVRAKLKMGQPYTLTYSNGYWYAMNVTDTTFEDGYAYRPGDTITSSNYEIYQGFGRGANSKTRAVLYLTLSKPIIGVSSATISWGQYALQFFDIESGTKVFADPGSVTTTQFPANGLQFTVDFPTAFTTGGNYEYGFFSLGEPTITFNASNDSKSAVVQSEELSEKTEEPIEEPQEK